MTYDSLSKKYNFPQSPHKPHGYQLTSESYKVYIGKSEENENKVLDSALLNETTAGYSSEKKEGQYISSELLSMDLMQK